MKLYYSKASPYALKVRASISLLQLAERVEEIIVTPYEAPPELVKYSPLSKVPVLVTEDEAGLYDSRVIIDYLDSLVRPHSLIPPSGAARTQVLRLQALGDGLSDANVLRAFLLAKAEIGADNPFIQHQKEIVARALKQLEEDIPSLQLDAGTLALASALIFMTVRFPSEKWGDKHPRLAEWFERITAQDCFRALKPF